MRIHGMLYYKRRIQASSKSNVISMDNGKTAKKLNKSEEREKSIFFFGYLNLYSRYICMCYVQALFVLQSFCRLFVFVLALS